MGTLTPWVAKSLFHYRVSSPDHVVDMREELLALHAQLLEAKPEGVEHDKDVCPLCALDEIADPTITPGGEVSDTFTQEQVDELVAKAISDATSPLQDRLAELEKAAQDTEVGQAVAAAIAPFEEKIAELEAGLDEATVRATAAEQAKQETDAFWADAISAHEEAEAQEARKATRVEQAQAAGVLTDEYISANADRFAAWSDDEFAARLEEWTQVASLAKGDGSTIPAGTGFQAARETAADSTTGSNLGLLREMRLGKTDPRSL